MNAIIENLYIEHHSWLHTWLKKRLNNSHTAADLAQDTFVKILQRQEKLYFDQPRALLTTVANGILVNWFQRQAVERAYLEVLALQPEQFATSPEQQAQSVESLLMIFQLLEQMSKRQQQTFIWSQLDGISCQEIAKRQQVCTRTVSRDLSHALMQCLAVIDQDLL